MYCKECGAALLEGAKFCKSCGKQQYNSQKAQVTSGHNRGNLVGFSNRIKDPRFEKYIRDTSRWSILFSIILAFVAVIGFTIAGEMGADGMDNPQSLFIGLGIGGMFIIIALFQIIRRKRSVTWDGIIEDKKIKEKTERHSAGEDDYYYEDYLEYQVIIRGDNGKKHVIRSKDDDTLYEYYKIGDRIRHHAGLNSYEKYDKTGDKFILCNACGTLCDINDDICFRCKCPLLK